MTVFPTSSDAVDLADARQVAATLELGRQPDVYNFERLGLSDGALAEGQNVGVVMRAIPDRHLLSPANAAANAFYPIGDNRFAVTGATKHDPALVFAPSNGLRNRPNEIRIIAGRVRVRTVVAHGMSGSQQHRFDGFFVGEAGMIRTDGNGEQAGHKRKRVRFALVLTRRLVSGAIQIPAMKTLSYLILPLALIVAGCSTVESRVSGHQADFNTWPPAVQQQVRNGQINIGFTREQVQVALGSPDHTFVRTAATGSFEVWSYADRGPRFSFGIGMASFGRHSATGVGIGTGTSPYPDERLRVVFDAYGRVSSIEEVRG